jgi:hypothetical protein
MPRDLTNEPQAVVCSDPLDMCYFVTDAAPWPSMRAVAVFRIQFREADPIGRWQWFEKHVAAAHVLAAVRALRREHPGCKILAVTGG